MHKNNKNYHLYGRSGLKWKPNQMKRIEQKWAGRWKKRQTNKQTNKIKNLH